MDNKIRLAGVLHESLVNGPGLRKVLFGQGCRHKCESCFNPSTQSIKGGQLMDMDDLVNEIKNNPMISGVTFSGGDPWEQADKFAYIAKKLKACVTKSNFSIWCYTGYNYEFILNKVDNVNGWYDLLNNIDVLVDGKFEKDKMDVNLKYRGSSNQRIIDVNESLKSGNIITLNY